MMKQSKIFNSLYGGEKLMKIVQKDVLVKKQNTAIRTIQVCAIEYLKRHKIKKYLHARQQQEKFALQNAFDQLFYAFRISRIKQRFYCYEFINVIKSLLKDEFAAIQLHNRSLLRGSLVALKQEFSFYCLGPNDAVQVIKLEQHYRKHLLCRVVNFMHLRQVFLQRLSSNIPYRQVIEGIQSGFVLRSFIANFLNNYERVRVSAELFRTNFLLNYVTRTTFAYWRSHNRFLNHDKIQNAIARTSQIWLYGQYFHAIFVLKSSRKVILQQYLNRWKFYVGIEVEEKQQQQFASRFYVRYLLRKYFNQFHKYTFVRSITKNAQILRYLYGDQSLIRSTQAYPIVRTSYINYFLSLSKTDSCITSGIKCLLAWRRLCNYRPNFLKFVSVFQARFQILKLKHKLRCWNQGVKCKNYDSNLTDVVLISEHDSSEIFVRIQKEYFNSEFMVQNYEFTVSRQAFAIKLLKDIYKSDENDGLMYKFQTKLLIYSIKDQEGIVEDFMLTQNNQQSASFLLQNLIKLMSFKHRKVEIVFASKKITESDSIKHFHHIAKLYERSLTIRYISFLFSCEQSFSKRLNDSNMCNTAMKLFEILRHRFISAAEFVQQYQDKCKFLLAYHSFNTNTPTLLSFNRASVVSITYLISYFLQSRTINVVQPDYVLFAKFRQFNKHGLVNHFLQPIQRNKNTQHAIQAEKLRNKYPCFPNFVILQCQDDWLVGCLSCAMEREFDQIHSLRQKSLNMLQDKASKRSGTSSTSHLSYSDLASKLGEDCLRSFKGEIVRINYLSIFKSMLGFSSEDYRTIDEMYIKAKQKQDDINKFDDQEELEKQLIDLLNSMHNDSLKTFLVQFMNDQKSRLTQQMVSHVTELIKYLEIFTKQNPKADIQPYIDEFLVEVQQINIQQVQDMKRKKFQYDDYSDLFNAQLQQPEIAVESQQKPINSLFSQLKETMQATIGKDIYKQIQDGDVVVEQSRMTDKQKRIFIKRLEKEAKIERQKQLLLEKQEKSRLDQLTLDQTNMLSQIESMLSQNPDSKIYLLNKKGQLTENEEHELEQELQRQYLSQGLDIEQSSKLAAETKNNILKRKADQYTFKQKLLKSPDYRRVQKYLINMSENALVNANTGQKIYDKKNRIILYDEKRNIFLVGKYIIQVNDMEEFLNKIGIKAQTIQLQDIEGFPPVQQYLQKEKSQALSQLGTKFGHQQKQSGALNTISLPKTKQQDKRETKLIPKVNSIMNIDQISDNNHDIKDEHDQRAKKQLVTSQITLEQIINQRKIVNQDGQHYFIDDNGQQFIVNEGIFLLLDGAGQISSNQTQPYFSQNIDNPQFDIQQPQNDHDSNQKDNQLTKENRNQYSQIHDFPSNTREETKTSKRQKIMSSIIKTQPIQLQEQLVIDKDGQIVQKVFQNSHSSEYESSESSEQQEDHGVIIGGTYTELRKALRKRQKLLQRNQRHNRKIVEKYESEQLSDNEYQYKFENGLCQIDKKPKCQHFVIDRAAIRFKRQPSEPLLSIIQRPNAQIIPRSKSSQNIGENRIFNAHSKPNDGITTYFDTLTDYFDFTPAVPQSYIRNGIFNILKSKPQQDFDQYLQKQGERVKKLVFKDDISGNSFQAEVQRKLDGFKQQDGYNIVDIICQRQVVGTVDEKAKIKEFIAFSSKIQQFERSNFQNQDLFNNFDRLFAKQNLLKLGDQAKLMQREILEAIAKEEQEDKFAIDLEAIINYRGDARETKVVKLERIARRRERLRHEQELAKTADIQQINQNNLIQQERHNMKRSLSTLLRDERFDRRKIVVFNPKADYSNYIHDILLGKRYVNVDDALDEPLVPFMEKLPVVPQHKALDYEIDEEMDETLIEQRQMLQTKSRFTKKNKYISKILTPIPKSTSLAEPKLVKQLQKTLDKLDQSIDEILEYENWLEAKYEQEERAKVQRELLKRKLKEARDLRMKQLYGDRYKPEE